MHTERFQKVFCLCDPVQDAMKEFKSCNTDIRYSTRHHSGL